MAAIIAQITRANRERIDNKKYEVEACKSMYQIRPFDRCFDKLVRVAQCSKLREIIVSVANFVLFLQKHNKYMVAKAANLENEEAEKFYNFVVERLKQLRQEEIASRRFSWGYES